MGNRTGMFPRSGFPTNTEPFHHASRITGYISDREAVHSVVQTKKKQQINLKENWKLQKSSWKRRRSYESFDDPGRSASLRSVDQVLIPFFELRKQYYHNQCLRCDSNNI